ncbi:hypothetical protein DFJ74DRAFT_701853 [Hyaloraphidium curvatum]|nr:hypothetical protein DFJ74DRAFT_701853 [Hyaloraphidium curvatum]
MPYVLGDGTVDAPTKEVWRNPLQSAQGYLWQLLNIIYLFFMTLLSPQAASQPVSASAAPRKAASTYNGNGSAQLGRRGSSSAWDRSGGGPTRRMGGNVHGLSTAADPACMPGGGGS